MVAEAAPAVEEPQVQGTVPETPEVAPESLTPETPEVTEEVADFSSLWEETTETPTGAPPAGEITDPLSGLTPEQILERGAERERARQQQAATTQEAQARIDGTRNALNNSKASLKGLLRQHGIDADTLLALDPELDKTLDGFHGSHIALRKADYEEGVKVGQQSIIEGLRMGVDSLLGPDAAPKFFSEHQGKPWPEAYEALVDAAAKKKGYVSPKELKENYYSKKSVNDRTEKLEKAANERGWSLKSLTGEANPSVPPIRGGAGGLPSFTAFNAMSIEEQEKFTPEQRSQIYANDAARRARG